VTKTVDQTFRVVQLPTSLLTDLRRHREATATTNAKLVADSVTKHLPSIVNQLRTIGLSNRKGAKKSIRLPFSTKENTLKRLRAASNETSISAVNLLTLCLAATTSTSVTARSSRRRQPVRAISHGKRREASKS
jgi:hypothetical protein